MSGLNLVLSMSVVIFLGLWLLCMLLYYMGLIWLGLYGFCGFVCCDYCWIVVVGFD